MNRATASGYARRVFILVTLLLLAGFVTWRFRIGYPVTRHVVLGRGEAAFLAAAAETLFPSPDGPLLDGRDADLPGYADRYLRALPIRQRRLIRAMFLLFEQATLIFPARGVGAFRRFSAMSPEQRNRYFEGWAGSRLYLRRMAFTALKAVLIMGYVGRDENLRALGLEPFAIEPVVCEADLLYPPIGAPRSAIALTRADLSDRAPRAPLRTGAGEGA